MEPSFLLVAKFLLVLVLALGVLGEDLVRSSNGEARGMRIRKGILAFLIGIVLKTASLVPVKLMFMTFLAIVSFVAAKIALAVGLTLAFFQHKQIQKSRDAMPPQISGLLHESTAYSAPVSYSGHSTYSEAHTSETLPSLSAPSGHMYVKRMRIHS